MSLERRLLLQSCFATCAMALFEMWFGYTRQLSAVRVDGLINGCDVALILASFYVAGLIRRPASRRFQYGHWHWENWMHCLRGSILILICLYAAWSACLNLMAPASDFAFRAALLDAAVVGVWSQGWCRYMAHQNRTVRSALVEIDVWSWNVSSTLNLGLLLAALLIAGMHIWGTRSGGLFDWVIGRMDALLTLMLTVWLGTRLCRVLGGMGSPLIGVTSVALDDRVRSALRGVAPHGMSGMHYRAQLRGRCVFVDVYVADPAPGQPGSPIDPRAFHAHISNALAQTNQAMSVTATFVACGTDLDGLQSIDNASGRDRPG